MAPSRSPGYALPVTSAAADYLPGDIVAWDLSGGMLHIGIVSNPASAGWPPRVVHNIGAGAREEDILFRHTVIDHYRLPPAQARTAKMSSVAGR